MKYSLILLIAAQATTVFSAAASAAAAECGDLGVMEIPEGTDPSTIRKCAEHPLRRRPSPLESSLSPNSTRRLQERLQENPWLAEPGNERCWFNEPYGCDRQYCWQTCGEDKGSWCWLAHNGGGGPWTQCRSWEDCTPAEVGDSACGNSKACPSCGCGC